MELFQHTAGRALTVSPSPPNRPERHGLFYHPDRNSMVQKGKSVGSVVKSRREMESEGASSEAKASGTAVYLAFPVCGSLAAPNATSSRSRRVFLQPRPPVPQERGRTRNA